MGPSGCGKSTLLRAINRMHELYPDIRISGEILMDNRNILKMNPMEVRRMAGMVFQRPNPFPTMSIFDNVIAGYKLNGIRLKKKEKEEIVETCLTNVGLWNEVKDALFKKGTFLSSRSTRRMLLLHCRTCISATTAKRRSSRAFRWRFSRGRPWLL